jgi:hypothetical protein
MGGRDHSYECETCGEYRGGLNDLRCDCDPCEVCGETSVRGRPCLCGRRALVRIHLVCLARNLRDAAGLCEAFYLGQGDRLLQDCPCSACIATVWRPGCNRPASGWEGE